MSEHRSEAYAQGYEAGLAHDEQAADCPIGHDRADERMDWMDGFGAARADSPPPTRGDAAERPLPPQHEG